MVEDEDIHCEEHLDTRNEMKLSMVFIRESTGFAKDDLAIFPPINHENLLIDGFRKNRESPSESFSPSSSSRLSDSSSSSSLSPSDSDGQFEFDRKSQCQLSDTIGKSLPSPSHLHVESPPSGKSQWRSLYCSLLEINFARVLSKFQKMFSRKNLCSFWSFYPILSILVWWWMRNRTLRRFRRGEIAAQNIIKERDERIAQLLHQIAQMNELLVKKIHSN